MQEACVVLHLARSGRLILKSSSQIRDGSVLVDANNRKTCKVIESIGPVSSPYLSAQPLTDRIERIIGEKLFLGDFSNSSDERFGRGRSRTGMDRGRRTRIRNPNRGALPRRVRS